jgi:hypothetical protein
MSVRNLLSLFVVSSALLLGACSNISGKQVADAGPALENPNWTTPYENEGN